MEAPRGRGRPSKGGRVALRLWPAERDAIRRWAEARPEVDRRDGQPVEADAIRRMVLATLAADGIVIVPSGDGSQAGCG